VSKFEELEKFFKWFSNKNISKKKLKALLDLLSIPEAEYIDYRTKN